METLTESMLDSLILAGCCLIPMNYIDINRKYLIMSRPRPLSPHLSIWRFQLPALMSITHRITAVILTSGTVLLTAWLLALAFGENSFNLVSIIISHPLGQFVMFGYSVVLFYHASNGVRHLFWDFGKGLDIPGVYTSGRIALAAMVVLTVGFWAFIFFS
jgi:succinate dehydrogenase / fumarate reductase cytochrome b subunit